MAATAIILAAGKGTRMNSDKAKVLHEVCGRPMASYVIDACRQAGCENIIVVVGHQSQEVREALGRYADNITWVEQTEQLGTGHAVMACCDELAKLSGAVLVLAGDGPLIHGETLAKLLAQHNDQAACTLATCIMDDPHHHGRIVRDESGELLGIVEYLDADQQQREIKEVNVSLYCFDAEALRQSLPKLSCDNAKSEYYITDLLEIMRSSNLRVQATAAVTPEEARSINTLEELHEIERILAARSAEAGERV